MRKIPAIIGNSFHTVRNSSKTSRGAPVWVLLFLLAKYSVDIFCCFRPYLIRVVDIHSLDRRDGISEETCDRLDIHARG